MKMDCEVIRDLLPLYLDDCCSPESRRLVEEHLAGCPECRAVRENMKAEVSEADLPEPPVEGLARISILKASVLQTVLFFICFGMVVIGVYLEANTPYGYGNGKWAVALIIPFTAFWLTLTNWYFVRLYKNRRVFSAMSALITLLLLVCGYTWAAFHYTIAPDPLFASDAAAIMLYVTGIVLSVMVCVLSKVFSSVFARLIGRD